MTDETTDDRPRCTCSADVLTDTADAMRAAIEGKPIPVCPIHRPAHLQPEHEQAVQIGEPLALNSDQLTQTIMRALGATDVGANL